MTLSLEELATKAKLADKFVTEGGEAVKALPGVSSEEVAKRAYELLKKRSRFLHSEVDQIQDYHWVSETLYAKGFYLEEEFERNRFYSTADRKFEDTSLGGNYVCNPRPGFTPFADPPKPGLVPDRNAFTVASRMTNQGMGAYYSEAIDDSYQVIHMRFGKPEFNSLISFFTGFYDVGAAYLANSGRVTGLAFTAGQVGGAVVGFVALGGVLFFGLMAAAYIASGLKGILATNPTKFYYSRPNMPVYWSAVTTIVNQLATHKGMFPTQSGDQRIGEEQQFDKEMHDSIKQLLPGVFDDSGYINVKNLVTRVERINMRLLNAQKQAIENAASYEELQSAMQSAFNNAQANDNGLTLEELINKWKNSFTGGSQEKSEKPKMETIMGGTLEERLASESGAVSQEQLEKEAKKTYNPTLSERLLSKISGFKEFLDAEFSDGSAFATFRVDHTGSVSESFSNATKPSDLAQKFNSTSAQGRAAYYTFAGGDIGAGAGMIVDAGKEFLAGALHTLKIDGLLSVMGSAYVDIPDHWENSVASLPSKTYSMRLVAPYGHPVSQLTNIYIPLAMILAGALPHAAGRQAYTQPFLCELYDQGRAVTRCGIIESLQITRGVSNLGFTKNKDMLAVDVQFSVKDLSSVMYVPIQIGSIDPFETINVHDSTYSDYMATLGSATLGEQIYRGQKLKLRVKNWLRGDIRMLTSQEHWAGVIRDLPIVNLFDLRYEDTGRGN